MAIVFWLALRWLGVVCVARWSPFRVVCPPRSQFVRKEAGLLILLFSLGLMSRCCHRSVCKVNCKYENSRQALYFWVGFGVRQGASKMRVGYVLIGSKSRIAWWTCTHAYNQRKLSQEADRMP